MILHGYIRVIFIFSDAHHGLREEASGLIVCVPAPGAIQSNTRAAIAQAASFLLLENFSQQEFASHDVVTLNTIVPPMSLSTYGRGHLNIHPLQGL
jgi:hypothetical protein